VSAFRSLQIPLPADGVLVFSSMNIQPRPSDSNALVVSFIKNAANTPVTLLVDGNVTIATQATLTVAGDIGTTANTDNLGRGGNGGPGGGRGGDGAYQLVNFATIGGAGLRPGGGLGGTGNGTGTGAGANGTFIGTTDLVPLVAGSGGGGGGSTSNAPNCGGGGGGGGGGAILIAANGTLTINGILSADGGDRGVESNTACASRAGGGSGGAIRLLANTIAGVGTINARSGVAAPGTRPTTSNGAIRMEAFANTYPVSNTDPLATRAPGPGPLVNVFNPTVQITSVGGQPVPTPPQGSVGGVDLVLPLPGPAAVTFATSGVPVGTTVSVTVKPKVGGAPVSANPPPTLTNCDGNGNCTASVNFNLDAGSYYVEARANFTTP
jgi:hypothetical protein